MHQVSFSRLAATSVLAFTLAACGSESTDQAGSANASADANLPSGASLKHGGLQRGDDLAYQNATAAGISASATSSSSVSTTVAASAAGATASTAAPVAGQWNGLQRGDDVSHLSASYTASAPSMPSSVDESSRVGSTPVASVPSSTPAAASSAPAFRMSSGDAAGGSATTATPSAAPAAPAAPAATPILIGGMQRGDETPSSATPAPVASAPASAAAAPAATAPAPAAAAAAGAPVVTTSAAPTAPPVSYRRKVPMSGPVAVPANFTGIHSHYWPGPAPAPTYNYGTARSLNYYGDYETLGILWYGINTADGVYDWSKMDNWVNTQHGSGKQIIYSLYGTPTFCASNLGIKDLYNRAGGDSKPSSLTCVQKFVDALVQRYNGDGVRRIQKLEIWNEPNFQGYPYWRNSAADLAALGRTVYQTAKAVDPGIQILWPAFVEWYSSPVVWADNVEYANASDGAGGTGKQWADAFAFHFYAYNTGMDDLMNNQESAIKTLAAIGRPDLDRHNTEMGFGDGYGETLSTAVKATTVKRWMALSAAYGNKVAALYAHESGHLGAPAYSPEMSAAINELNQKLAGKTIRDAGVLEDGRVFIVFGDNSTWII